MLVRASVSRKFTYISTEDMIEYVDSAITLCLRLGFIITPKWENVGKTKLGLAYYICRGLNHDLV